jgi:hypothetical protein
MKVRLATHHSVGGRCADEHREPVEVTGLQCWTRGGE